MDGSEAIVTIRVTPTFKRNLRALSRKYRQIASDLEPLLEQLQAGDLPGDQVHRVPYECFTVRLPNSSARKGKRGGFRVLYIIRIQTELVLVTIYSKTEQADVSVREVQEAFQEFLQSDAPSNRDEQDKLEWQSVDGVDAAEPGADAGDDGSEE